MNRKRATAQRLAYNDYAVTFGRISRRVRYSFLLALAAGGWAVTVEQSGYRLPTEPERYEIGRILR
jgi:hypothetical protein